MSKGKIFTAALIVLSIILCMMSIYMQREYTHMRIAFNRADRDYAMLRKDYEKLYNAYYSYDKKVLKLLEANENVFWAEDSTAYLLYDGMKVFFAFYKKPKMDGEYFFWPYGVGLVERDMGQVNAMINLEDFNWRVDTLKPHQFIYFESSLVLSHPFVAPKRKNSVYPEDKKLVEFNIERR